MTDKQEKQLARAQEIAQRDGLAVTGAGRTKDGRRVWAVPSRSEPNRWHLVIERREEARLVCDCQAAQHGKVCAHRAAVRERLLTEREQPRRGEQHDELGGVTFTTSRWANPALKAAQRDTLLVGISNGEPKWPLPYAHVRELRLAPDPRTLKAAYPDFRAAYLQRLSRYGGAAGLRGIFAELAQAARAAGKRQVALLCFEDVREASVSAEGATGSWCHRQLLASVAAEQLGLTLRELSDPTRRPSEREARRDADESQGVLYRNTKPFSLFKSDAS